MRLSRGHLQLAAGVLLVTALGFVFFPGQTWLQQDSQIYAAILEHLYNPSVLANDLVATRPHVAFTIYDELAVAARRLTGLQFYPLLTADQLLFRACGVLGVFLIALAAGLPRRLSLLVAAVYALGATVLGPAVLTVEYEPKPRGSAMGMLLLAVGLACHRRYTAAGLLSALAFLYHPPTTYPVWGVFLLWALWGAAGDKEPRGRWKAMAWLPAAAAVLLAFAYLQPGDGTSAGWFSRLSPELERLQRLRSPYTWVSMWIGRWIWLYLTLLAVTALGLWRLRETVPYRVRFYLAGLSAIGALSIPVTWLLYDTLKWGLMARFQPARAVLWVILVTILVSAVACLHAALQGRRIESLAWGAFAFILPTQPDVWQLLLPDLTSPLIQRRLAMVIVLGALFALAGWFAGRAKAWQWAAGAAALVLPFLALPYFGKVVTERNMHEPELDELAAWARRSTPLDAVFLFPDAGKGRQPGIFRVKALRAVYVDWKSGGQVNMVENFAEEWWRRYETTMLRPLTEESLDRFAQLGIDYAVVRTENAFPDRTAVFRNSRYAVYRLQ